MSARGDAGLAGRRVFSFEFLVEIAIAALRSQACYRTSREQNIIIILACPLFWPLESVCYILSVE